jgi:hypothetical protein
VPTQRASRPALAEGPNPFGPMVKEAKDTEMAKAVEGSEHDIEPRKLEYSPSRKPRLAPDPPELGDTRKGSIALMAFCFVGLLVPRCPPSILTRLRARTLCNPPHLQRLAPWHRALCAPAAAACPVTRACSMPAPCSRPFRPPRPRALTPAAARRTGLLPHLGLPAGEGDHDRAPCPEPSPSPSP